MIMIHTPKLYILFVFAAQTCKPLYIIGQMTQPYDVAVESGHLLVAGVHGLTAYKQRGTTFVHQRQTDGNSSHMGIDIYEDKNHVKTAVTSSLFTQVRDLHEKQRPTNNGLLRYL